MPEKSCRVTHAFDEMILERERRAHRRSPLLLLSSALGVYPDLSTRACTELRSATDSVAVNDSMAILSDGVSKSQLRNRSLLERQTNAVNPDW